MAMPASRPLRTEVSPKRASDEAMAKSQASIRPTPPPTAARRAFGTGALLNLLNPKAYLFFVVVAPEFLGGRTLGLSEALTLALVSTGIATAIHLAIVLAGSRAQAWLADPARTKWVRRGFAVVMLGVAASFLAIKSG